MNSEVLDYINQAGLCRAAAEHVAEFLPADDEEVANGIVAKAIPGANDGLGAYRTPILQLLPVEPNFPLDPTQTLRRSVERIGRNDPCHCGSGPKYNCHQDEDRRRQQSSGVAGRTLMEMRLSGARHLTLERIQHYSLSELGRMDPSEVPRHLRTEFFLRVTLFNLDRAAELLERLIEKSGFEDDERLRDMRQKVKTLEASLKDRHDERNTLQRQLEAAQEKVETLRERVQHGVAASSNGAEPDLEDDLLLPPDAEGSHPVRLIEFPKGFHDRLNDFPHHVARGAMVMLGRLAGGDSTAFSGANRLKSRPNVVRQRIGIDFRLLFRLLPDRIQVIDLIPRQDFERKIKTLI